MEEEAKITSVDPMNADLELKQENSSNGFEDESSVDTSATATSPILKEESEKTQVSPGKQEIQEIQKEEEKKTETQEDPVGSGGAGSQSEEEDEEDSYRQPIMDTRNITFQTRILNPYLLCSLCMGYFKDAFTIIECLHTFCKSCIYKYLCSHSDCPQCGVQLGTNPFEKIKYDRQLQQIVDKIFVDIVQKDTESEKTFLGLPLESKQKQKAIEPAEGTAITKRLKKSEAMKKFYSDEVAFELTCDENTMLDPLKHLDKPFIRTSAKVTVKHLKKYLQKKLNLDVKDLEITYRGEILGNEHSLEYILKTRGIDPNTKNPNFKYRLKKDVHSVLVT